MSKIICLHELQPGEHARVRALRTVGSMRRRLLDLGLIEDTEVTCLGRSPLGDPSAYQVRGTVVAIRAADGADILLEAEEWD